MSANRPQRTLRSNWKILLVGDKKRQSLGGNFQSKIYFPSGSAFSKSETAPKISLVGPIVVRYREDDRVTGGTCLQTDICSVHQRAVAAYKTMTAWFKLTMQLLNIYAMLLTRWDGLKMSNFPRIISVSPLRDLAKIKLLFLKYPYPSLGSPKT